jgi:hypothetical protein
MSKPDPISEKKIDKINMVLKDMIFNYDGPISNIGDGELTYRLRITGQKHMISVGEYYNYLIIDVIILDGSHKTTVFIKYIPNVLSDYKTLRHLSRDISEELQYFFGSDHVRVNVVVNVSEEYQQKIDELPSI